MIAITLFSVTSHYGYATCWRGLDYAKIGFPLLKIKQGKTDMRWFFAGRDGISIFFSLQVISVQIIFL